MAVLNVLLFLIGLVAYEKQIIDYRSDDGSYVVVVVLDGTISERQAKAIALRKAAELTVAQGQRYFVVQNIEKAEVIQAQRDTESQWRGNLYYELIQEKDFTRDRLERSPLPDVATYPALRIDFTMTDRKTAKAIDPCTLTECH